MLSTMTSVSAMFTLTVEPVTCSPPRWHVEHLTAIKRYVNAHSPHHRRCSRHDENIWIRALKVVQHNAKNLLTLFALNELIFVYFATQTFTRSSFRVLLRALAYKTTRRHIMNTCHCGSMTRHHCPQDWPRPICLCRSGKFAVQIDTELLQFRTWRRHPNIGFAENCLV
jgi:hypothetical protein